MLPEPSVACPRGHLTCTLEQGATQGIKWISLFGQEDGLVLVVLLSQGREYQNLVL
jgi:hypothetical protein